MKSSLSVCGQLCSFPRRSCTPNATPSRPRDAGTASRQVLRAARGAGVDSIRRWGDMDGVHDLGGMHGFGPVEREADEPVFHAPWEAVVVAIRRSRIMGRFFNIDEFRHGIERMDPAHYLGSSYYERWLDGLARV